MSCLVALPDSADTTSGKAVILLATALTPSIFIRLSDSSACANLRRTREGAATTSSSVSTP